VIGRDALEADGVRAFGVFAEHLNFTTAAAELNISQPALHVKIRKLGSDLGTDLYERQGRGLILTDAGRRLAEFSRERSRQVEDFLTELHPDTATLSIAAGRSALRWVIGDGIRRLVQAGRVVNAVTADRNAALAHLASGRVDLVVAAHDPPPSTLRSRHLATYPQMLVVPQDHSLARRRTVSLTDLDGQRLVVPTAGRPHRSNLERALRDAGVDWLVAAEVDGWDLLMYFVDLGTGVTIVNGCVPPPDGLTAIPVEELPHVPYWAAWRPARNRLLDEVLQLLAPPLPTPKRRRTPAPTPAARPSAESAATPSEAAATPSAEPAATSAATSGRASHRAPRAVTRPGDPPAGPASSWAT
jgi:DNA-binding transcriptional LysR family regulator